MRVPMYQGLRRSCVHARGWGNGASGPWWRRRGRRSCSWWSNQQVRLTMRISPRISCFEIGACSVIAIGGFIFLISEVLKSFWRDSCSSDTCSTRRRLPRPPWRVRIRKLEGQPSKFYSLSWYTQLCVLKYKFTAKKFFWTALYEKNKRVNCFCILYARKISWPGLAYSACYIIDLHSFILVDDC